MNRQERHEITARLIRSIDALAEKNFQIAAKALCQSPAKEM